MQYNKTTLEMFEHDKADGSHTEGSGAKTGKTGEGKSGKLMEVKSLKSL